MVACEKFEAGVLFHAAAFGARAHRTAAKAATLPIFSNASFRLSQNDSVENEERARLGRSQMRPRG